MSLRLFLADDHRLFRDALRPMLDRHPELEVIGEASDGLQALQTIREMKPDIALLDISMPGMNGIEITRQVVAQCPDTSVIILSMHADRRFVIESLKAGARAYVLKESSIEELFDAIQSIRSNRIYLSPVLSDLMLREYIDSMDAPTTSAYEVLSGREREVLQLLAEGRSTRESAEKLHLSVKTVETHRAQIKSKLGMQSIAELTRFAIREGIITLDS
ncbi:response regulator transcription factor [bacterium]|nr:response regulator transcription factor [bacterium]